LKLTKKQNEAIKLIHQDIPNVLLYGGARSGKSYVIVADMIATALLYPGSRQLIARLHFNHAKNSVWNETLLPILKTYPDEIYKTNSTDLVARFYNGSEIFVDGLDEKDRIEKILGREFCKIYLNECSQIPYSTVTIVKTRLAQRVKLKDKEEFHKNKIIYDMNPPSPTHYTHKLFIEKINPDNDKDLNKPNNYQCIKLNPTDNLENLSDDYIDNLKQLPEMERKRFLFGEFVKPEGCIYERFDYDTMTIDELPKVFDKYVIGVDLGNNIAVVLIGWIDDAVYIIDEFPLFKETPDKINEEIVKRWEQYDYVAYTDINWGEMVFDCIASCYPAKKGQGSVIDGINFINQLIESNKFFVSKSCLNVLSDLDNYVWNPNTDQPVKENDHFVDALRYAIYSEPAYLDNQPVVSFIEF